MDTIEKLRDERDELDRKIRKLEENIKVEGYVGKCYQDKTDNVYYKILYVDQFNNASYIRINLECDVEDVLKSDYDGVDTFTDYYDTIEITKEEFNTVFAIAIGRIREL